MILRCCSINCFLLESGCQFQCVKLILKIEVNSRHWWNVGYWPFEKCVFCEDNAEEKILFSWNTTRRETSRMGRATNTEEMRDTQKWWEIHRNVLPKSSGADNSQDQSDDNINVFITEWDGLGMWRVWIRRGGCIGSWWGNRREGDQ